MDLDDHGALTASGRFFKVFAKAANPIVDTFDFPIVSVDRIGRILESNRTFAQLQGMSLAQVRGRFLQEDFHTSMTPADHLPRLAHVVESGTILRFTKRVDGDKWYRVHMFPIKEGNTVDRVFVCAEEVTDLKMAERDFQESQEQLAQIANAINDAFCVLDYPHMRIVTANGSFCRLFQIPQDRLETIGKEEWLLAVHPQDRKRTFETRRLGQRETLEYRICLADGSIRWVRSKCHAIKGGIGSSRRMVHVITDITDERKAKEDLCEHVKMLMRADKLSSLGVMVAEMAHEVNNPNHLIGLNAEMLRSFLDVLFAELDSRPEVRDSLQVSGMGLGPLREEMLGLVGGIDHGVGRIRNLVDNLKHIARDEKLNDDAVISIEEVVVNVVSVCRTLAGASKSNLQLKLALQLPEVRGNQQQLEQALLNLVTNALQALDKPNQSVQILVDTTEEDLLRIQVVDDGPGMSPEIQGRIFEPFFSTKMGKGGTGLGLPIVQRIIQSHGGTLQLNSTLGKGTRVCVLLPVRKEQGSQLSNPRLW